MKNTNEKQNKKAWFLKKRFLLVMLVMSMAVSFFYTTNFLSNFGGTASGERLERMQGSPQYHQAGFRNTMVTELATGKGLGDTVWRFLFERADREPCHALVTQPRTRASFATPRADGIEITWLGHSTMLVDIEGHRILTDPVFGERASPSSVFGPKRFFAPPIQIEDLPPLDAVVISHDHYDHLDAESIEKLAKRGERFFVPLGVGAHLERWGVPADHITELDWWEEVTLPGDSGDDSNDGDHAKNDLKLVSTPSRHFSGRTLFDGNATLWTSWVFLGAEHRVYFSGDTGYFPGFKEIGERFGPFDVTMIEIGAFDLNWAHVHLGPENALQAHQDLKGQHMLPVHWGTFNLGLHPWQQPIETLLKHAKESDVALLLPRPGQSVRPDAEITHADQHSALRGGPWWRTP